MVAVKPVVGGSSAGSQADVMAASKVHTSTETSLDTVSASITGYGASLLRRPAWKCTHAAILGTRTPNLLTIACTEGEQSL